MLSQALQNCEWDTRVLLNNRSLKYLYLFLYCVLYLNAKKLCKLLTTGNLIYTKINLMKYGSFITSQKKSSKMRLISLHLWQLNLKNIISSHEKVIII